MTQKKRRTSPAITITITDEQQHNAVTSNSGGCLIADAIKAQYPEFTRVSVDMATIRVTDRERGERYTYLTPPAAQHVLLSFDQGWPNPVRELTVKQAVHIAPIYHNDTSPSSKLRMAKSRARLIELERRMQNGENLTGKEKGVLTRLRDYWAKRETQPTMTHQAAGLEMDRGRPVVTGGRPLVKGPDHPNLLRGRNRHFGAKLSDPGIAFRTAVEQEVQKRLDEKQS